MDPSKINWLAVVAAAFSTFLLGGFWYSKALFGPAWQRLNGLRDEELAGGMAKVFGGSFALALVSATNLAFFLGPQATIAFGAAAGFAAGAGWVATGMAVTGLFERRAGALVAINAGYHVVSLTVMGVILGAWR